jgi:pimeloyl-ACP methyl ester carboxylesterase
MQIPAVTLRAIRSFFVGGQAYSVAGLPAASGRMVMNAPRRAIDPNGDYMAGQAYVQEYRLARPEHRVPIVFWHGGGMSGACWESTPDERPGWVWHFLLAGYDVLVCDAVERGRASWAMYPQIYRDAPVFRSQNEAWHLFRIGPPDGYASNPAVRRPYPGQQFPVHAYDAFARQWVPRWTGHESMVLRAYQQLIDRLGACILVGHSQGAGFAVEMARRNPSRVRAVVAIEPGGMPRARALPASQSPHLMLWGDFLEDAHPIWRDYRALADDYWQAAREAGGRFDVLDLPRHGMAGNSHCPMLDANSDVVAQRVIAWLQDAACHCVPHGAQQLS